MCMEFSELTTMGCEENENELYHYNKSPFLKLGNWLSNHLDCRLGVVLICWRKLALPILLYV